MLIISILASLIPLGLCADYWTWTCSDNKCVKERLQPGDYAVSLEVCELSCFEYSRVWPVPNGHFEMQQQLTAISLDPTYTVNAKSKTQNDLLMKMFDRFMNVLDKYTSSPKTSKLHKNITRTKIHFIINDFDTALLDFEVDESYTLNIEMINNIPAINIYSPTIFGARNALETLSQLIVYDSVSDTFVVPTKVIISDGPKYPIRGLMIDTSRNYLSIDTIRKIIEGMAVNKLNTLHWHITDSQSFPFVSVSLPELSGLGAYSPRKVYTHEDIQDLVQFALVRGVRIIPEFDAPAHVGEGWQDSGLVVCFDKQPWGSYCKEPPCGQFDPTKEELYSTLTVLYRDLLAAFNPVAFHFGGDEVEFNCWRSEESIKNWMKQNGLSTFWDSGYVELWSMFQNKTYNNLIQEAGRQLPAIMWTSTLTDKQHLHNLPNDKYIIHVWTDKKDSTIANLLQNNYKIIISNYDALYLDCGFHKWTGSSGNNWCSPYKTWQLVYENSPALIAQSFHVGRDKTHLIMGSIAALWTETVDDASAENRIWPRTAALAERVWAEPFTDSTSAEYRLNSHRERMVKLGIQADTLVPEWCAANQDSCT